MKGFSGKTIAVRAVGISGAIAVASMSVVAPAFATASAASPGAPDGPPGGGIPALVLAQFVAPTPAPTYSNPPTGTPPSLSMDPGTPFEMQNLGGVDPGTTAQIVKLLNGGNAFCGQLPLGLQIDCLADQYKRIADTLPSQGDYGEVRTALYSAAKKLTAIVDANVDPEQKPVQPHVATAPAANQASRPLRYIRPDRQKAVTEQAVAVVDELSGILLRSAANSERRKIPFEQIAQAVDSNKVLLRSAT